MAYASTGCSTGMVWTVKGPIRWLGCQVRQSKCSAMNGLSSLISVSLVGTSYASAIREAALAGA
jgi:hypothetical protein